MWRIILVLILLVVLLLMIRQSFREFRRRPADRSLPAKDTMIQDPVCKLYIAAGDAVVKTIAGRRYHFCSDECAGQFTRSMS